MRLAMPSHVTKDTKTLFQGTHSPVHILAAGHCACVLSHISRVRFSATPWTMAHKAPLSTGFSGQEYWSGLPFPSPVIKYEVSEVKPLSRVWLFVTPWTVAYQAPPSMGFSRQEYWSGLPLPSPNERQALGIKCVKSSTTCSRMSNMTPGAWGALISWLMPQ